MWSPSVTRSTPASRSRLYSRAVSPEPPAAFSALAITTSTPSCATSAGSAFRTKLTPGVPTMSPMKRMRMVPLFLRPLRELPPPLRQEVAHGRLLAQQARQVLAQLGEDFAV